MSFKKGCKQTGKNLGEDKWDQSLWRNVEEQYCIGSTPILYEECPD